MTTKPNPLAVMDDLFEDLTIAGNYSGEGCWFADGEEARAKERYEQARAAVAELVEKAHELAKLCDEASSEGRFADGIGSELTALEDVQAALARFEEK
jgi:hypothetical protein